jgi:hypothetical protein
VAITLERPADDTGARLVVTLVPDRPTRKGRSPQLTIRPRILQDNQEIMNTTLWLSGTVRGVGAEELGWKELSKNLATALAATPDQYLLIQVRCADVR